MNDQAAIPKIFSSGQLPFEGVKREMSVNNRRATKLASKFHQHYHFLPSKQALTRGPKMKRLTFSLLCTLFALTLFSSKASAQDWAQAQLKKSPRHREWVAVKHDSRAVN